MTNYYERLEDSTIGTSTPFEDIAKSLNLTNFTDEEIVYYENKRYLQSEFEIIQATEEYKAEQLEKAKALKFAENVEKRNERLNAGVLYKGVMFDSDTDSKVNIMGAVATLPDEAVVGWNSMDNQTVELTKVELNELGGLLVALTSLIWGENGLNVQFINAINAAQSLEDLQAIEIEYNKEQEDENTPDINAKIETITEK